MAALGVSGAKRTLIQAGIAVVVVIPLVTTIAIGSTGLAGLLHIAFDVRFWPMAFALAVIAGVLSASGFAIIRHRLKLARTKTIKNYPTPGVNQSHEAKWEGANFDKLLSAQVGYARAAIAIDERRADFDRVKWGPTATMPPREPGTPDMFIQSWFARNHWDIGGSYEETDSRLSDISLKWMLEQAVTIPHGLKVVGLPEIKDRHEPVEVMQIPRLRLFPSAAGMQHCEIAGMRDTIEDRISAWYVPQRVRAWARDKNWAVKDRERARLGVALHHTVEVRLALDEVDQCDGRHAYRPALLKDDDRFRHLYAAKPKVG